MRLHKDIWWLLGSTVAAVCAAPLLVHGDAEVTARRTTAAKQIEELAPAQRQELNENLKRFGKLPAAEQDFYRALHNKVKLNPPVAEALEAFAHWWPTVSAREQAEIFGLKDNPAKRRDVVRKVQDRNQDDRWGGMFFERAIPKDVRPSKEDFYRVMDAVEAIAVESLDLSTKDQDELEKLPKHTTERTLELLRKFGEKHKDFSDIVQGDAKKARLVEAVSSKPFQEFMRSRFKDNKDGGFDGAFLVRASLVLALLNEMSQEGAKQAIGDADLLAQLNKLPVDGRADVYQFSADEQRHRLKGMILAERFGAGTAINDFFEMPRWRGGPFERGGNDPRRGGGRGDSRDGRDGGRPDGPRGDGARGPAPNDNKP